MSGQWLDCAGASQFLTDPVDPSAITYIIMLGKEVIRETPCRGLAISQAAMMSTLGECCTSVILRTLWEDGTVAEEEVAEYSYGLEEYRHEARN